MVTRRRTGRTIRTFSKNDDLVVERRQQIVEAASKVFYAKGFKDCTVRDLCEACGLTPGGLYRYIGSKKDILRLMSARVVGGSESLRRHVHSLGDQNAEEVLRCFVKEYFKGCDDNREANTFFNREIANFDAEDRGQLLRDQIDILDCIQAILRRGEETGEFRLDSPVFVAHLILMMGHDWGLRKWYLGDHFTLEQYTEKSLDLLMSVLRAAPAVEAGDTAGTGGAESPREGSGVGATLSAGCG